MVITHLSSPHGRPLCFFVSHFTLSYCVELMWYLTLPQFVALNSFSISGTKFFLMSLTLSISFSWTQPLITWSPGLQFYPTGFFSKKWNPLTKKTVSRELFSLSLIAYSLTIQLVPTTPTLYKPPSSSGDFKDFPGEGRDICLRLQLSK